MLEPGGLGAAFEVVFGRSGLGKQALHRLELIGPVEMRRTGDRDLGIVEVVSCTDDRERLDRLRRAAEERDELRDRRRMRRSCRRRPRRRERDAAPRRRRPRTRRDARSAHRARRLTGPLRRDRVDTCVLQAGARLANGRDFPYVPRSSTVTLTTSSTTSSSSRIPDSCARSPRPPARASSSLLRERAPRRRSSPPRSSRRRERSVTT